jgi:hypothetical protein
MNAMGTAKRLLTATTLLLMSSCGLFRSYYLSDSITNASKRGTLVCQVDVKPAEFSFQGQKVRFREAWLEESFIRSQKVCYLCFTLAEGESLFRSSPDRPWSAFFVVEDEGMSVGATDAGHDGHVLFFHEISGPGNLPIRVSPVTSFGDSRPKNIRFSLK